jgi:hypothetical protein
MSDRMRALLFMLAMTPLLLLATYWKLNRKLREQVERTKAVWPVSNEQATSQMSEIRNPKSTAAPP